MNKKLKLVLLSFLSILLAFLIITWLRNIANPSDFTLEVKIALGYLIILCCVPLAYLFGMGKSKKSKYKIWGVTLMVPISAPLAYSIGLSYAIFAGSGFAALIMLYISCSLPHRTDSIVDGCF